MFEPDTNCSTVEIGTGTHLRYQLSTVIPWYFRNLFRAHKDREPLDSLVLWNNKQLHHFSESEESSITSHESD
jgi:hypothetical protein